MAVVEIRADLAPEAAIRRAIALIEQAGFPRSEHVHEALGVLQKSVAQADIAAAHRERQMGQGRFCGCCGRPKRLPLERRLLDPTDCAVTADDARPAGKPGECFYCLQPIGEQHKPDCVIRRKTVRVQMTVEFDHDTVESWRQDDIEFHLNDSSFCLDNLVREILVERHRRGCLCKIASCEVVGGEGL